MEKELDSIKLKASDVKREMISMARKEGDLLKETLIQDANKKTQEKLALAENKSEKEAAKSISKAEEDVLTLEKKIDSRFDEAVNSVRIVLLGE